MGDFENRPVDYAIQMKAAEKELCITSNASIKRRRDEIKTPP